MPSGTGVRVFLKDGPSAGIRGVPVSGTADTLRVIAPSPGLLRLPADTVVRLETPGPGGSRKWISVAGGGPDGVRGTQAAAVDTTVSQPLACPLLVRGMRGSGTRG